MERRTFVGGVAAGLLAWPLGAAAQPAGPRRIGYLGIRMPDARGRATSGVPSRPARAGLDRVPERDDRVALGGTEP